MESTNILDQKPHVVENSHLNLKWSDGKPRERFRCYLCGHKFQVGDTFRFVFANFKGGQSYSNFLTCTECDGPDILSKWEKMNQIAKTKFWWFGTR